MDSQICISSPEILLCGSSRHRGEPQLGFSTLGAALPMALGDMKDLQMQADGAYRCDGFWTDGKLMKNMVRLLHHLSRDIFSYLSLISLQVYVFWKWKTSLV